MTAHALDQATPSVNIALTPYTTSTTWYKDGKEVEAGAAFEANANYEVKTVLTAVGDYRFADSSKPQSIKLSDGTSVKPEVNVAADYRSMTVSYSFKTEEVPCTCEITDLVFDNQTIQMAAADTSKTLKLAAKATAADCAAHEKNITYTYTLVDAGTTKAALEGDVLTVSAAGTAKVKVVAELNGKTAEKEITVTVTSDKATEASRTELGNTVNNAKAIDKTLYTEDSVKALETAITNAEAVLAKENASETEVAAAKKAVQDAIDALQKKDTVDKDKEEAQKALSDAVTKADAVYAAGQGQYTKESWDAFEKAYKAAKEAGADLTAAALKDLTAALEICDFAMAHQRLDGGIAMSWNRDGSVHTLEGTAGAFLILPLVKAFEKTHKEKYNIAAVRAYSYYFREFKNCGYGTSGALDTCCIDKESVIPLLKGGIMLYEATGFERYLKMAQKAAWYLSTWQWHQSVVYPSDSILGKMGYDTFGGTAVSTSHHHIDPFALCYVEDLKKLAIFTKNTQWESRAFAIWYNASQGISDGTLMIGETGVRPRGSCDEGILHTRWGNNGNYFGVSQWLVAWPCAFRLEVLRKLDNWNWLNGEEQEAWL